jgi:hypothetical protein
VLRYPLRQQGNGNAEDKRINQKAQEIWAFFLAKIWLTFCAYLTFLPKRLRNLQYASRNFKTTFLYCLADGQQQIGMQSAGRKANSVHGMHEHLATAFITKAAKPVSLRQRQAGKVVF